MMAALRAAAGSIREYSRGPERIRQINVNQRDIWGTVGALHGRMIAGSFITGRRRVPMASRGVNARSWSGGMSRRSIGQGWIHLTSRKRLRLTPRKTFIADAASRRWAGPNLLFYIPMAWDGCSWPAG